MNLYNTKLGRDVQLTDFSGKKKMPFKVVISHTIEYLKSQLLEKCKEKNTMVDDSDINWVLTVPSIWTDPAKQLMREATEMAGIAKGQLILSLEPEAASIFCKHELMEKNLVGDHHGIDAGEEYMVIDAGGGTTDIVVHQVQNDGCLSEVVASTGGNWGGNSVNEALESLLVDIVGRDTFDQFKSDHISDFLNLMKSFNTNKKKIGENQSDKISFSIPASLLSTFNYFHPEDSIEENIAENQHLFPHVEFLHDRLSGIKAFSIFSESVANITDHVGKLLLDPQIKGISNIMMVGGYSRCPLLIDGIRRVAGGVRLVQIDADLAVLKGSVIFGHVPCIVSQRISRYTYGVDTWSHFIEGTHMEDCKVVAADGTTRSKFAFSTFVKKGEAVKTEKHSKTRKYTPAASSQNGMNFTIYASSKEEAVHVTDESCKAIGKFTINLPETTRGLDRTVCVTMWAGGTEINIKAEEEDSSRCISSCDFLI